MEDLKKLEAWLENRQPLIAHFQSVVAAVHDDPWPSFRVTGSTYDMTRGVLRPTYSGVPGGRVKHAVGEGPVWSVVVELATRVTAARSRRWDAETRKVRPIPKGWRNLAAEAFPFLCHLEIGDGWSDLMITTAGWIAEIGPEPGWRFSQIKEKYGTLRLYDAFEAVEDICDAAELLSGHMCEKCGAPGRERSGGWISTLCDEHA